MSDRFDEAEALDLVLADFQTDIHTAFPAKVLAYDADAQTVDVRPAIKREGTADDGGYAYDALPDLFGVQIMWPRAGGFAITFPIAVGDWVKVTCAEQSTMAWRRSGVAPSAPGISDPHGLNGLVAEVGWCPDREKLTNVSTTRLEIRSASGATKVALEDDLVTLGSSAGSDYVALAGLVSTAIALAITGHTHSGVTTGTGVSGNGSPVTVSSVAATKVKAS